MDFVLLESYLKGTLLGQHDEQLEPPDTFFSVHVSTVSLSLERLCYNIYLKV